ncbi:MAG: hypothetical protein FWF10_05615 [Clostridiales bacterium]|nr:hypothetical protein [Clostridiales bacterium]
MKKALAIVLVSVLAVALLVGCVRVSVNPLVGKYTLVSLRVEGVPISASLLAQEGMRPEQIYIELKADGTFMLSLSGIIPGADLEGEYTVKEGVLSLHSDGELLYTGTIEERKIILDMEGIPFIFEEV